jgi:hypothetical protein
MDMMVVSTVILVATLGVVRPLLHLLHLLLCIIRAISSAWFHRSLP